MEIYYGLKLKKVTIDERLDILLNTKWTIKEYVKLFIYLFRYNTELTHEIEELIDREADMINRGRPAQSLDGK